jgi:hypothetical protein
VRLADERVEGLLPALAAVGVCFCALFFGDATSLAPLVWIGAIALLAAAALLFRRAPGGLPATAFVACLGGLALWCGLSIAWSASPDDSWTFTNRTLVYAGFGLLGVLAGGRSTGRVAGLATALAALVIGWALLAKCVPALYSDYGRVARLRAPIGDWNMLALVCAAAVPLALWLGARARVASTVLLYFASIALLLTYSRFGVALAILAAAAWIVLEPDRVESIVACLVAGAAGAGAYGIALALSGITSDEQPHRVRAHDGWVFLLVLLGGAAIVALVALALTRVRLSADRRRVVERAAAAVALVIVLAGFAVTLAKAGTIWRDFTNPVAAQTTNAPTRLGSGGGGNRWSWWQEAWHGFTAHPLGGTGAGTFRFTDLRLRRSTDITALEPHNTPLQFLSETGIVGFLLYLGVAAAVLLAAWRRRGGAATALGITVAVFFAHTIVNYDWSFVAVTGPFLLLGGVLVAEQSEARARRPLVAAAAVVFALGCVYSLAAPWLADRIQPTSIANLKRAHSYDPLSTSVLTEWAFFEGGNRGVKLFRDAIALEPTNSNVWFDLATYYAQSGDWKNAYGALSKAFQYDPYGPAGQCGLAEQIRRKVGVKTTCRGAGSPSTP